MSRVVDSGSETLDDEDLDSRKSTFERVYMREICEADHDFVERWANEHQGRDRKMKEI